MDGDEVSTAQSCTCKASCMYRMFDSDDVKDHILTVHELEKGEPEIYIMIVCIGLGMERPEKAREEGLRFRFVHSGPLDVGFPVEDLSDVYAKEWTNGEEKRNY